jgi:hypothetical protein
MRTVDAPRDRGGDRGGRGDIPSLTSNDPNEERESMTTIEREPDPIPVAQVFRGYKWLARGAVDPDTSTAWEWSDPDPCSEDDLPGMVFATSIGGLPYRIDDELWEVELIDVLGATPFPEQASYGWPEVFEEHEQRILARRGRLLRRMNVWTPEVAREFALDRARATSACAILSLRDADRALGSEWPEPPIPAVEAEAIERELLLLEHVESQVAIWREALSADAFGISHPADAYAAAAAAAAGARARATAPGDELLTAERAYAEERRRQASWLRERLGLPSPGYAVEPDLVTI